MKQTNFLELVFERNAQYEWRTDETGLVTVFIENKGMFHWIFQKILGKPRISQVHMEEIGSYIWRELDGRKTVLEIGQGLGGHFGEKAMPLYERLTIYIRQLLACGFLVRK